MVGEQQLQQWWNALSDEERAEALEAQARGQLTPSLVSSLRREGVLAGEQAQVQERGKPLPSEIERFLKARH